MHNFERGLTPELASGGRMGGLAPADFGPWLLTLFYCSSSIRSAMGPDLTWPELIPLYILNSENVYHFLFSHTIIMPIPIPDQKAGSCALPALKIQVVLRSVFLWSVSYCGAFYALGKLCPNVVSTNPSRLTTSHCALMPRIQFHTLKWSGRNDKWNKNGLPCASWCTTQVGGAQHR